MIDVAHHCDYGRTRHFDLANVLGSEKRFERLVRHLVFEADDDGVGPNLARHILHQLAVERLVHSDKDSAHQQGRNQVLAAHSELLREVLHADALGHRDGAGDGQRLLRNLRSTETRWRSKALHRAFFGLRVLLASTAAWRTTRTLGTRRLTRRRIKSTASARRATGTGTKAGTATRTTRALAEAGTATRRAARRGAGGMHGTAPCRKARSACGGAGTRRIAAGAAGTTGTLEDGTATLDNARTGTWSGRRTGTLRHDWARRRCTVDGPRAGLRHDHTLDGRCR